MTTGKYNLGRLRRSRESENIPVALPVLTGWWRRKGLCMWQAGTYFRQIKLEKVPSSMKKKTSINGAV